jgi:Protein of unknown function (DUF4241)
MTSRAFQDTLPFPEAVTIGKLHLPTGRICACDPFFAHQAEPFARVAPVGAFDVRLTLAFAGTKVARASVMFGPTAPAAVVERAVRDAPRSSAYCVEGGLGAFMDEQTRRHFVDQMARFYRHRPDGNFYADILAEQFRANARDATNHDDSGLWAMHRLPEGGGNVAMFASGHGDGVFESFWTLDDDGVVISLTTDFAVE